MKNPLPSCLSGTFCQGNSEMNKFAIIIPVYNHADAIKHVICNAQKLNLPIIVVDDGSTDETYKNIKDIENIQIIQHTYNLGKGAALTSGFLKAAEIAKWGITLDADGQHNPDNIKDLINALPFEEPTIIIGKRMGMTFAPWTSQFGCKFSNFWVWISGGPLLEDSQSGFRCYPLPEVNAKRYQYEVEVIVKAAWQGMLIMEVPVEVSYFPKGQRISHFHPWKDFFRNTLTFSRLITKRLCTPKLWFHNHRNNCEILVFDVLVHLPEKRV